MLTSNEINVIGNILNTTWGKFSTDRGSFPIGSAPPGSLTGHLVQSQGPVLDLPLDVINRKRLEGNNAVIDTECSLVINYIDMVSFRSDLEVQANVKVFRDIAEKRCAAKINEMRQEFRGVAGRALKIKAKESHDSVEAIYTPSPEVSLIAAPRYKPTMYRGYYRYTAVYSIS